MSENKVIRVSNASKGKVILPSGVNLSAGQKCTLQEDDLKSAVVAAWLEGGTLRIVGEDADDGNTAEKKAAAEAKAAAEKADAEAAAKVGAEKKAAAEAEQNAADAKKQNGGKAPAAPASK